MSRPQSPADDMARWPLAAIIAKPAGDPLCKESFNFFWMLYEIAEVEDARKRGMNDTQILAQAVAQIKADEAASDAEMQLRMEDLHRRLTALAQSLASLTQALIYAGVLKVNEKPNLITIPQ